MAREEYIATLKAEEKRLSNELNAIRNLISIAVGDEPTIPNNAPELKFRKDFSKGEGIPKGDNNWDAYVIKILSAIGGSGKTRDVVDYAIKANPKLDQDTILTAVRGKLSKLYIRKIIGANVGSIKSEGYEYFVDNDSLDRLTRKVDVIKI